jgi:molybdopterin-guanine dinucleotide biosynthesis protein B
MEIHLEIDDVSVPLNPFVQKVITNSLLGMIHSLEGIPEDPECITLSLTKKGKKNEKI